MGLNNRARLMYYMQNKPYKSPWIVWFTVEHHDLPEIASTEAAVVKWVKGIQQWIFHNSAPF